MFLPLPEDLRGLIMFDQPQGTGDARWVWI